MKQLTCIFSLVFTLLCGFCSTLNAEERDFDLFPSTRFTLDREQGRSPIIYYLNKPDPIKTLYPLLIICDGSLSKDNLTSVLFMRQHPAIASKIERLNVGCLAIEKWGIDGNQSNEKEFWQHYTRSQRLDDHLRVIQHLQEHPPGGWNGKILLLGASEGGPLVTDLSILCHNVIATIVWSGAGEGSWTEELWQFMQNLKQDPLWSEMRSPIDALDTPFPETREEFDGLVEMIKSHPTAEQTMCGMTYLYLADAFQRSFVDYGKIRAPFLVVTGTEDSIIDSSDRFVQKARDAGAPITYFRIEGMDHYVRKRPDVIDRSFEWLKQQLQQESKGP